MQSIPDKSVDLIICDLPYGCLTSDRKGKRVGPLKDPSDPNSNIIIVNKPCAWDVPIDLEAFWKEVRRIRKDDHVPTIHFCTTKFGFELHASNPKEFRYDLLWDKQRGVSFLSANKMPMRSHEMIYVFSKAGANYYRKDIEGDFPAWVGSHSSSAVYQLKKPDTPGYKKGIGKGKRCALSVISNIKTTKANAHPTEKPMELYKWLIERYSKEGDTILDPTFGSGNSVFTAVELGRKAIGIEKDKKFFDKANAAISHE
jgi:site-specific DNA-methyltransferase (adenine-specific)